MRFFVHVVITAVAVWIATLLPFDVVVEGGDDTWWGRVLVFLLVGLLMAVMNAVVRPVVNALTLPIRILTLGLFSLVIGWFILWLAAWISTHLPWATLDIGGFWDTVWAALVIAIATGILTFLIPIGRKH